MQYTVLTQWFNYSQLKIKQFDSNWGQMINVVLMIFMCSDICPCTFKNGTKGPTKLLKCGFSGFHFKNYNDVEYA